MKCNYLKIFFIKILNELIANNIEIYQFPTDDETVRNENTALNALLPFAIVGSTDFVTKEDGRLVRARRYPWGIVEGTIFILAFINILFFS